MSDIAGLALSLLDIDALTLANPKCILCVSCQSVHLDCGVGRRCFYEKWPSASSRDCLVFDKKVKFRFQLLHLIMRTYRGVIANGISIETLRKDVKLRSGLCSIYAAICQGHLMLKIVSKLDAVDLQKFPRVVKDVPHCDHVRYKNFQEMCELTLLGCQRRSNLHCQQSVLWRCHQCPSEYRAKVSMISTEKKPRFTLTVRNYVDAGMSDRSMERFWKALTATETVNPEGPFKLDYIMPPFTIEACVEKTEDTTVATMTQSDLREYRAWILRNADATRSE